MDTRERPAVPVRARILRVGAHRVDVGALRLLDATDVPRLTPKAVAVLLELGAHPGVTLSREDLLLRVWGERCPTDDVLTQAVRELRRALGDDTLAPTYIETVPRVGYRMLAEISWEAAGFPASPAATVAINPSTFSVSSRWRPRGAVITVLAIAAAAVVACIALLSTKIHSEPVAAYRVTSSLILTADPGAEQLPHVSPDGSRVAYLATDPATQRRRVQLRLTAASTPLLPTSGAGSETWPVWSADGASMAFLRFDKGRCSLMTVPALGGAERVRGDCGGSIFDGFDWSADGSEFMVAVLGRERGRTARLARRTVDGGETLPFDYAHDPLEHDLSPRYSPDGRHIAFRRGLVPFCDLYVVAAEGGAVRAVTHVASRIRGFDWLADSRSLVFASDHEGSSALYTVELDGGKVTSLGAAPAQFPDAARNANAIVYEIPKLRSLMVGAVLDAADATAAELAASTGSDSHPALSPDGTRVAFVSDRNGSLQLWVYDSADAQSWPLTEESGTVYLYPEWRADGRRLLATRRREGRGSLIEIDLASHVLRTVSDPAQDVRYGTYAPSGDGFLLLVHASDGPNLLLGHAPGDPRAVQPLASRVARMQGDVRDGSIYFSRLDQAGLFVVDASGVGVRHVAAGDSIDTRFAWRVVADSLWYFEATADDRLELKRRRLIDGEVSVAWRPSIEIDHTHFSVGQDGRRVVVTTSTRNDTDIGLLRILRGPVQ